MVDAGYHQMKGYLGPYRNTRYHLPEFQGGRPPIGYKTVRGILTIDEVEAPIVKMIFEMREVHNLTLDAIAEYLTDQHIANKSGEVAWSRQRIHQIVRNKKFYQGFYKYGDMTDWVQGEHEAIL